MPRIDSQKFYNSAIALHGITAQGVNWTSQKNQELRFDILLSLLPQNIISLGDAGCGFGHLYTYMKKKKRLPQKYFGIDVLSQMQIIASKYTQTEILLADITKDPIPNVDYYLCSGAMNVLHPFETLLFIKNCFNASRYGFIFNILHGDKPSQTYNYMSTAKIQSIAKNLNVKRVEIRDDYMPNDITIGFFHV